MRILVTGGAGLIGSHTCDRLLSLGYEVIVLDVLTRPVHPNGQPTYLSPEVDLYQGDTRNRDLVANLLRRVDAVYHLAACQDYLPEFSRFSDVNVVSTALLHEIIVAERLDLARVVVASSRSAKGEGLYRCPADGDQTPGMLAIGGQLLLDSWLDAFGRACVDEVRDVGTVDAYRRAEQEWPARAATGANSILAESTAGSKATHDPTDLLHDLAGLADGRCKRHYGRQACSAHRRRLLFRPVPHRDERGSFCRTFHADVISAAGLDPAVYVQHSLSRSVRGAVRGMHVRRGDREAKLARCSYDAIFDVIVDLRPASPAYHNWESFELIPQPASGAQERDCRVFRITATG